MPRPHLTADPWLWAALALVLLVVGRAWGAAFGEPVADDFDHLRYALLGHGGSWFDGGGSASFWRPLAYQGYYGLLHDVIMVHPAWISALHVGLLALATVLLYDLVRDRASGREAFAVAGFPLLLEAVRALILVPVHIVDLGLFTASVVAWWCAARGWLWPALLALAAALLCKETAVATALLLPWLARTEARGGRRVWFAASALVVVVWAAAYLTVRHRFGLALPHGLESQLGPGVLWAPERYTWAIAGSLRALVSLPMRAESREPWVTVAVVLVLGFAVVRFAVDGGARARWRAVRGAALVGFAWFALATGTLLTVYPVWSPERVVYASLGLGLALGLTLAAANAWLPLALVLVRVITFALAPGAPEVVSRSAPERGAFVDFERLARLQRLMREARTTLRREFPVLPRGANVAMLHPPFMADYAGGDRALQVWYRDTTLRWVRWDQMEKTGARGLAGAMEFQEDERPPFRRVEPEALRLLFVAGALDRGEHWQAALDTLERAEARQADRAATHFVGRVLGLRAWCLGATGHLVQAESLARASLAIAPENADGHLTLAALHNGRSEWNQSLAQLDTLLTWYPDYQAGVMMRQQVVERLRADPAAARVGAPPRSRP
ncbi:MAG: hypothetical protein ABL977_13810 [Candidatus Eisenbacteria bacterium]